VPVTPGFTGSADAKYELAGWFVEPLQVAAAVLMSMTSGEESLVRVKT
jgi:hypothetical protein